jgi:NAD(P)-dependent dehydrogenase (short-subunit alcohol dehydrogenase family)
MGMYALTGGATGIGAAIKQQLIGAGHQLISIDIRDADIIADLSSPEGRKTAIDSVRQAAPGGLDGLITCAGLGANVSDSALIASVNYFGTIVLATELAEWVARKQGCMVLISSNSAPMATDNHLTEQFIAGDEAAVRSTASGLAGQAVYSSSKQAVARWMRRNVNDFAARGIRINAVAPGYTRTPMTAAVEQDPVYGEAIKEFLASIPLARPGLPEDMANATQFLLSPEASFICGSVLFVDGGHDAMLRPDQF